MLDFNKIVSIVLSGLVGGIVTFAMLPVLMPYAHPTQIPVGAQAMQSTMISRVDGIKRAILVSRAPDLSFRLIADINGRSIPMLMDTGATITVLSKDDADRIGIRRGNSAKTIQVFGINNIISNYRQIGNWPVKVGPINIREVPIAVDESGQLKNSILGQNAFCNIDRITIQHNTLSMQQNTPVVLGCDNIL